MKATKTSIPRGSEVGHPKDTYWTPTPEEKKKREAATKDMARIKKEFKYSRLGITPEMADAVNAHVNTVVLRFTTTLVMQTAMIPTGSVARQAEFAN